MPDAFTEADAGRLEVLARQAGIALSNARLLERLRRSERQLRDSEARYRYLVTASPDVVWEIDLEGRFTFVSDAVERMTGWAASDVVGQGDGRGRHGRDAAGGGAAAGGAAGRP